MQNIKKHLPNKATFQRLKQWAKTIKAIKAIKAIKPILIKRKKTALIVGVLLVLTLLLIFLSAGTTKTLNDQTTATGTNTLPLAGSDLPTKTQAGDYIKQRLQDLSDQLGEIKTQLVGNEEGGTNLSSVSQKISGLMDQTKQLSTESNKMITTQIQESNDQLNKRLATIQEQLEQLKQEQAHVKYLKPSDLPFTITAIDNIQQSDVVTVNYSNTVFPVELDSYIAGWKLIHADFVSQQAEFVNDEKQHVVVDLNRTEKQTVQQQLTTTHEREVSS